MMDEDLAELIVDLKEEEALKIAEARLRAGEDPFNILDDCRKAMEIVGKRFETREYSVPEILYSSDILKEITKMVKPKLTMAHPVKRLGKVVIGTVAGDIHDIGKDIVSFMLDIHGFEVYDLGVDVPAQKFIEIIKETHTKVLGLSGLLTLAFYSMKETIDAIKEAGLRDKIKIMIGGGQMNEEIRKYTGADAYAPDAMAAVSLAKKWVGGA
jgi:5-methyltetrahydrofolate--homocysteine methyltransferase